MPHVIVPPLVTAYALFVAMVVLWWRRPVPRPPMRGDPFGAAPRRGWRSVLTTAVGGYGVFLLIVLVFHTWFAGQRGALLSAATGGAFLVAAWLVISALAWLLLRRRARGRA